MNCIFCRIIRAEIPSTKVYEDELIYAFEDIEPQARVHSLVVPKEHIENLNDISDQALWFAMLKAAQAVAKGGQIERGGCSVGSIDFIEGLGRPGGLIQLGRQSGVDRGELRLDRRGDAVHIAQLGSG